MADVAMDPSSDAVGAGPPKDDIGVNVERTPSGAVLHLMSKISSPGKPIAPKSPARLRDQKPLPKVLPQHRVQALFKTPLLVRYFQSTPSPTRRMSLGSDATLEEFQSENRQLKDEIATLEEKLQNYKEMLKHSRASYDAAVETLTRTITSHETVAVCLLMEKYEAETTQSKEELMAIEQVQTTLSESVCARAHQPFFFSSLYARLLLLSVPL